MSASTETQKWQNLKTFDMQNGGHLNCNKNKATAKGLLDAIP